MGATPSPAKAIAVNRLHRPLAAAGLIGLLGACAVLPAGLSGGPRVDQILQEQFGSTATHSRDYGASGAVACEAARRALLSQGYVISHADAERVNGKKNFQPEPESHIQVEFHVVCAPGDRQGRKAIAFVNALQDRYALKKSNNSASLGVGVLGSVSLPISSSNDAMVRVASETITTQSFYDRFFALLDRYLIADGAEDPVPEPKSTVAAEPAMAPKRAVAPAPVGAVLPTESAASGPAPAASSP